MITPTAPTLPPTVEEVARQTPVESYMNDCFTVPASLAGLPAASVPVPLPRSVREGMEEGDVGFAGLQVVGQFGDDGVVLRVAGEVEGLWGRVRVSLREHQSWRLQRLKSGEQARADRQQGLPPASHAGLAGGSARLRLQAGAAAASSDFNSQLRAAASTC